MSEAIARHRATLEQWIEGGQIFQQDEAMLADLVVELKQLRAPNATSFRQEMNHVTALLHQDPVFINESTLTFLIEYLIELLKQWCVAGNCDDSNDSSTFQNIALILEHGYYENRVIEPPLSEEIKECLHTIGRTGRNLFTSPHIHLISRLITRFIHVASDYSSKFISDPSLEDAILQCIYAPYIIEVFTQLRASVKSNERSPAEQFVFDVLIQFLSMLNLERLSKEALALRKHLLPSIDDLLKAYLSAPEDWSESAINILSRTTNMFLYHVRVTVPNDQDLNVQSSITDTAIKVMLGPCRSMPVHANCIQYVYMGTQNDKLLDHLKSQKLTPTLLKLIAMYKNESEIQFNIYRILAAIMTEEDIKRLEDPGGIAGVFLDNLKTVIDNPTWEVRLKNLLGSLKILLQHDQIRDEIYKQGGVPLFVRCATNPANDSVVRHRSLENLLIMSFNKTVCEDLKKDATLLAEVKDLAATATDADLHHAAESLLWVLTKDEATESPAANPSPKTTYDVMISYSHKDKDLCFQLYERLQKDKFSVWLDRDQMHGTPLEAMSSAIEQSAFVLVCMSDDYKQSGYCKMEAYYALERQCCIIPLVMKDQYRPDGWLGIIVTGRMRIDFPKYGFDDAYEKLLIEIDRHRKEKKGEKNESSMKHHEALSNTKASDRPQQKAEPKVTPVVKYEAKSNHQLPSSVEQWTTEDVQQFLIKQRLTSFLPICSTMSGMHLFAMYRMCLTNSPVMYQTLNHELSATNTSDKRNVLVVAEYLQFLDEFKAFVPASLDQPDSMSPQSIVCTIA